MTEMTLLRLVCAVGLVVVAVGEKTYTSRWDNMDVNTILKNERLLRTYFRCLMDQGRCSKDAAELRKHLPEALGNQCAKCTAKQKENIDKVMKFLYDKKKDMFNQLENKYDPEGTYRKKYEGGAENVTEYVMKEAETIKMTEETVDESVKLEEAVRMSGPLIEAGSAKEVGSVQAAETVEEEEINESDILKLEELEKADSLKDAEANEEESVLKS